MPLIYRWKDLDEQGFHGIHLARFWIQIHFKKPGFGKEKSVEDVVTLGPMAQSPH